MGVFLYEKFGDFTRGRKIKRFKKTAYDFLLNIIASLFVTGILQFAVYPYFAKNNTSESYGLILTIMGVINMCAVALGNSLNNVRLIMNAEYEKRELIGDFNILLFISAIFSILPIIILGSLLPELDTFSCLLLGFTLIFVIARAYYQVSFRLRLDFKKILILNAVLGMSYLCSMFLSVKEWPIVFLSGELAACMYLYINSPQVREPLAITELFWTTTSKYGMLIGTGLMANIILYLDRLLLYPVIGGEAVSAYSTASFFGKSLGMVIGPIAGVMLGYYAQKNFDMTRKLFWSINIATIAGACVFSVFAYFAAPWFTGLIYPTLIESARPYVFLANTAAIIAAIGTMTQPSVLRYAPTYWQAVIQVVYGILYIAIGVLLLQSNGIYGFCIAAIIANIIRLMMLFIIGHKYI